MNYTFYLENSFTEWFLLQEKLPEPTAADIAREAELEAAIFAEGRNIDQLLEMLAGLDPTSDSVTENEHIQVLL